MSNSCREDNNRHLTFPGLPTFCFLFCFPLLMTQYRSDAHMLWWNSSSDPTWGYLELFPSPFLAA